MSPEPPSCIYITSHRSIDATANTTKTQPQILILLGEALAFDTAKSGFFESFSSQSCHLLELILPKAELRMELQ
jgi:hypothetical protein